MKTKIRTISFYHHFSCLGADCPQSCCHGWRIPVDLASVSRYDREPGILGIRAKLALSRRRTAPSFNRLSLGCPLHDPDGLCALQKKRGEKFLPETCRIYPREWANLGSFVERTLDLSCVRAAEVFLEADTEDQWGLAFSEETGLWEKPRAGDNDDSAFLTWLFEKREEILKTLIGGAHRGPEDLDEQIFRLTADAKQAQSSYLRTTETFVQRIGMFPFSIMLLNELMSTSFFESHLRWSNPLLYRSCRRYYRLFDPLTEIEGQKRLDGMVASFFAGNGPAGVREYMRYFAYCLLRSWFDSYEDYSFVRRIAEAAIHTNMLLLFELLSAEHKEELSVRRRALMISAYEKRARHNDEVLAEMVGCVLKRIAC
ncbi:MAG: flagellin lysine-N-methylase [Lachnospiraceae bacterium]|nr:flagellin lysine-N-methylase [Lachnospiraceae bacterium]